VGRIVSQRPDPWPRTEDPARHAGGSSRFGGRIVSQRPDPRPRTEDPARHAGGSSRFGGRIVIGVLALQGAFRAHAAQLAELDVANRDVRRPADLAVVDALVMPGGESTTMSNLLTTSGLFDDVKARISDGMPVFGTCAGLILLATEVLDGRPDQRSFGILDATVRRNGYGRQLDSFETDLAVSGLDGSFHGVFIRAPRVESVGPAVEVLAEHDGDPVLVRQDRVLAASFHPELAGDARLHQLFVDLVKER
jgi:5'-phosphate synthase pdxT subunit